MDKPSEPSVLGAGSYRSVSILRLTEDEKKIVIEALKIARITSLGSQEQDTKLVPVVLKDLLTRFQGANEIWLTSSTTSKSG